jgi:hypothetical protein
MTSRARSTWASENFWRSRNYPTTSALSSLLRFVYPIKCLWRRCVRTSRSRNAKFNDTKSASWNGKLRSIAIFSGLKLGKVPAAATASLTCSPEKIRHNRLPRNFQLARFIISFAIFRELPLEWPRKRLIPHSPAVRGRWVEGGF